LRAGPRQGLPPGAAMSERIDGAGAPSTLSVRDLRVHFMMPRRSLFARDRDQLKAVDGVSYEIRPGETLGLVGQSRCRKPTPGRAILQLIRPASGQVIWLGEDLTTMPAGALRATRQDMQIVFQDPLASLDPRMTVGDIIGEPLRTFHPRLKRSEQ